ncbi:ABC transporter ATP-binding protein [Candidatus Saccharibacteria bacterium]|nr:ABC transporter ATP-binding protein [Candidatus Saccharibacteria bacterium]
MPKLKVPIYYTRILRHFIALKATRRRHLAHLAVSALSGVLSYLLVPFVASRIINSLENSDFSLAFAYIALFLATATFYLICRHYNYWAYYINANNIHNILQARILKKVTEFDASFTKNISKATLVSTAFRDIDQARQVPDFFCDTITHIVGVVTNAVVLCFIDLKIGFIVLGLLLIAVVIFVHHTKKRDRYQAIQREHADELSGLYSQIIDGYKEVQVMNLKENLSEYHEREKQSWKKYYGLQRLHRDYATGIVPVFIGIGRFIVYFICIDLILKGEYSISMLVLVLGYFNDILNRYEKICNSIDNVSRSSIAVERLYRLLRYETPHMLKFGNNKTDNIKGVVEFSNVSFTYDEPPKKAPDGTPLEFPVKKAPSFKNISFKIEPKTFTAIVGKSGSGKSTIFRLLLRLYKVTKGDILLDGESIYDYTKEVFASNVSLVAQKPFVFDMTIRENFNLVNNNIDEQIAACKLVGIHNDIMKLENGYDTPLRRDAENLSTGQKQLLSLARTLLSKSEVLLFDEVTSSLDPKSTEKVVSVLKKLKEDHTVIMITHKPELMRLADRVLVVDKGRLVGEGSPKELLKSNSYYQSLQK